MRIPRCYFPRELSTGQSFPLTTRLNHYLINVLRLGSDSKIRLFNNSGYEFLAVLRMIDKKHAEAFIEQSEKIDNESTVYTHLYQAISKGDKMEFSLQKSVELGVNAITPIFTERSEVKLKGERLTAKLQHWRGVIISACEQSGRAYVPELNQPILLEEIVPSVHDIVFVFDPHEQVTPKIDIRPQNLAVVVGPEGGFSEREILQCQEKSFQFLKLGNRILRAETATLVAIAFIQTKWGDFAI